MKITRDSGTQQYEHVAVIAHGAHPEYRLEFDAEVKNEAASKKIRQGSVVSLNADGQYVLGCGAGAGYVFPVPCISMKNIYDPDVMTGRQGIDTQSTHWSPIGGKITAIPCTGSYEIETTEFKAYVGDNPYIPGTGLVPADADDTGLVKVAETLPGDSVPYLGFVSQAPYKARNYRHNRLSFFANFIPARFAGSPASSSSAASSSSSQG